MIEFDRYFAGYNTTIDCSRLTNDYSSAANGFVDIECFDHDFPQFFRFEPNCLDNDTIFLTIWDECNWVDSEDDLDDDVVDLAHQLTDLFNDLDTIMEQCDEDAATWNYSLVFDIGYPIYSELELINLKELGHVCCRGYHSCAVTNSIQTQLGSIACIAHRSCAASSLIWTGTNLNTDDDSDNDDDDDESDDDLSNSNIYCVATDACEESILDSANSIICGALEACRDSVILEAKTLYCIVSGSCSGSIVRNVDTIYMLSEQSGGVTIYSGGIGNEVTIRFMAKNSGNYIIYHCETLDICNIICNYKGCGNTTWLYCDGQCNVECDTSADECPIIVTSPAPTMAPTTEELLLTESDVNTMFNAVLGTLGSLALILIIIGYIHSKKIKKFGSKKNELFNWKSLLIAFFYFNDFISDIFFTIRLAVVAFDFDKIENDGGTGSPFFVLFILSLIFTVIPFWGNIIPLHFEISKWNKDPILKESAVPQWVKAHVKILYLLSVITGSSFSAIALCNSYLFRFSAFSMGLSHYHKSIFQNKRFVSVVLLEVSVFTVLRVCCVSFYFWIECPSGLNAVRNILGFLDSFLMCFVWLIYFKKQCSVCVMHLEQKKA